MCMTSLRGHVCWTSVACNSCATHRIEIPKRTPLWADVQKRKCLQKLSRAGLTPQLLHNSRCCWTYYDLAKLNDLCNSRFCWGALELNPRGSMSEDCDVNNSLTGGIANSRSTCRRPRFSLFYKEYQIESPKECPSSFLGFSNPGQGCLISFLGFWNPGKGCPIFLPKKKGIGNGVSKFQKRTCGTILNQSKTTTRPIEPPENHEVDNVSNEVWSLSMTIFVIVSEPRVFVMESTNDILTSYQTWFW